MNQNLDEKTLVAMRYIVDRIRVRYYGNILKTPINDEFKKQLNLADLDKHLMTSIRIINIVNCDVLWKNVL